MSRRIEIFSQEYAGLAWSFQVNPDSCGNSDHYEQYIRLSAITDRNQRKGLTYVLIESEDGEQSILGFITMRTSSMIKQYDNKIIGEAALEITEIAVDKRFEHQGIGTLLLALAVTVANEINESFASVRYVAVCADRMAVPFYKRFGFDELSDYGDIPRDGWNKDCVPMTLRLPDKQ